MGADEIDFGDDFGLPRFVVNDEVVRADRAQAHAVGWIGIARPVPAVVRLVDDLVLFEKRKDLREVLRAEALALLKRELERGAFHVVDEDRQVVRVDEAVLGRAGEKILRMIDDELVEWVRVCDEDGDGNPGSPSRTPRLLPRRCDSSRIAGDDGHVECADVDPELERVRRDDAEHRALPQTGFDLAPLFGEVPAPVASDDVAALDALLDLVLQDR